MSDTAWRKMVHLLEDAHVAAKVHCAKNHLVVGRWVSKLILEAVEKEQLSRNDHVVCNEAEDKTRSEVAESEHANG